MIKKLFGKGEDEYIELGPEEERKGEKVVIQIERLEGYNDSERILNKLREGNILLVKIKSLREKDDSEFKRSMERMKKTCSTINSDIGSLGNDWLLLTPSFAKIHKS